MATASIKKVAPTPDATPIKNAEKKLRPRRPVEERIKELQEKINKKKEEITNLEARIEGLENPQPRAGRKPSVKSILSKAKEIGMTPEEIADKLGF